jgi:hypothetical protein
VNTECWLCVLASVAALVATLWAAWLASRVRQVERLVDPALYERVRRLEEVHRDLLGDGPPRDSNLT